MLAFSLRDIFGILDEMKVPVHDIRLGGGGARSALWRQIQSEVYGREVQTVEAEEGAAYGAAILAAIGARIWPTVDDACQSIVRVAERVLPDDRGSVIMSSSYTVYRRIYPALRCVFQPQ